MNRDRRPEDPGWITLRLTVYFPNEALPIDKNNLGCESLQPFPIGRSTIRFSPMSVPFGVVRADRDLS